MVFSKRPRRSNNRSSWMFEDNTVWNAAAVAETLDDCAGSLEQLGPVRWSFLPSNGADLRVEARIDEGWLLLNAGLPARRYRPTAAALWHMLEQNGGLPGGAKLARLSGQRQLSACAELRLDREIDLGTRLSQACAGLKAAEVVHVAVSEAAELVVPEGWSPGADEQGGGRSTQSDSSSSDLRELCEESGWTFTEQPGGRLVVDLDVPGEFHQAALQRKGSRQVVVTTNLAPCDGSAPARCRQALGLLLLRACGVVRMARAAAGVFEARASARFEVAFDTEPCAGELAHALSSLSTACRLCAKEADVLHSDERIAREYLARWGRASLMAARGERGNGRWS
jgi:hypothetical protein